MNDNEFRPTVDGKIGDEVYYTLYGLFNNTDSKISVGKDRWENGNIENEKLEKGIIFKTLKEANAKCASLEHIFSIYDPDDVFLTNCLYQKDETSESYKEWLKVVENAKYQKKKFIITYDNKVISLEK